MKKLLLTLVVVFAGNASFAQIEGHVSWAYAAKKVNATHAVIYLKADIDDSWHIYSTNTKNGAATAFKFSPSKEFVTVGKVAEPMPVTKYNPAVKMNLSYFENSVVFQQKVKLKSKKATVKGSLEYTVCDDHKCLPPETVEFAVQVAI